MKKGQETSMHGDQIKPKAVRALFETVVYVKNKITAFFSKKNMENV